MQYLVTFKPGSFDVVGDAARSWSVSADGRTWTFELNRGLVFADGTPLDAKAVKYNFDRWRLPPIPRTATSRTRTTRTTSAASPASSATCARPRATRVVIELARPLGPFLRDIAEQSFGIGSPAAIARDPKAFELRAGRQRAVSGERSGSPRRPHHARRRTRGGTGPKPAYPTVIIRDIPDQATSVLSIEKGDIDMLTDPRPDDAKTLAKQPGITRRRAAVEQRELRRDGRGEEAVRRRARAPRGRVRDRRRDDGEEPLLERRRRRRQLDAARDARRRTRR